MFILHEQNSSQTYHTICPYLDFQADTLLIYFKVNGYTFRGGKSAIFCFYIPF